MSGYEDVEYVVEGATAVVTINRPERYNAFRGKTVDELIRAFRSAWADRAETGDYGPTESGMFEIGYLHRLIRDIPKPVIAAVNGIAVGGGHVLHVLCDLSIASETARFGQAGPRAGSFDAQAGLSNLAMSALDLFTSSPEGMEGAAAFAEKRAPDFASKVIGH